MKKTVSLALFLSASMLAASSFAAGPGGMGDPGGGGGSGGPGRMMFDQSNVRGWSLMTQEERIEHRDKMHRFQTYDECKAYQAEHHKLMEERAKEKGAKLPAPSYNACDRMKARGFIK